MKSAPGAATTGDKPRRPAAGSLSRLIAKIAGAPSQPQSAGGGAPPGGHPPGKGELPPGSLLGRFRIVGVLGRGGFGLVYEAEDPELRRRVAIKVLRPRHGGAWPQKALLQQEAEAVARLHHPAIVTLHDVGHSGEQVFLVYELLSGETLESRLARGAPTRDEAFRILGEVARALAHAHGLGVVHRDLKPGNVFLLDDGSVKVLDFGLALFTGAAGLAAGTPPFVAPEQWRGEAVDARADVYAWGMLARALFGDPRDPRPGRGAPEGASHAVQGRLAALAEVARAELPEQRPPDGTALLDGMTRLAVRRRRKRTAAWLALVLALVAMALLARSRPVPPLPPGPFRLAVGDAENSSGDPTLDGLGLYVAEKLDGAPRLEVLDRSRLAAVLRASGRAAGEHIDAECAAHAARQVGAAAFLVPAAARDGPGYLLTAVARQPVTGEELFRVRQNAPEASDLLAATDRLVQGVLAALREREPEVRSSEAEQARAITTNLEAHRRYFQGVLCTERPSHAASSWVIPDCDRHFLEALAIDPDFPLAHLALARSAFWQGRSTAEMLAQLAPALRHPDRMPAHDWAQLQAWKAFLDGEEALAHETLARAAKAYPGDAQVALAQGDLLVRAGVYREAVAPLQSAWKLDPGLELALDELVWTLGVLGRTPELRRLLERLSATPPSPGALHAEVQARGWLGEHEAAVAVARRAAVAGGQAAREDLVEALAAAARLEEAEALARHLADAGGPRRRLLGALLALQGRWREARPHLEPARSGPLDAHQRFLWGVRQSIQLAARRDAPAIRHIAEEVRRDSAELAATLAPVLAYAGDVDGALALRPALNEGPAALEALDALVAWRRDGAAAALPALRRLARGEPRVATGILAPEALAWLAAECAVEAEGGGEAALADLRRFQAFYFPLGFWRAWAYPRSLVLEARLLEGLGRRAEALAALDRLETLWRRADPGQPLLDEARDLRRRLQGGAGPVRSSPGGRGN